MSVRVRKPKPLTESEIRAKIEREYERWNEIAWHGCQDPGFPDGVNMDLVRNHILYWYHELYKNGFTVRNLFGEYPEERPVPPKVPQDYMVRDGRYPDRLKRTCPKEELEQLVWGYAGQYAL